MKLRVFIYFFISIFLTNFIDAILWKDPGESGIFRKFIYLSIMWVPSTFLCQFFIFFVYFLVNFFLIKKCNTRASLIVSMTIVSVVYFLVILSIDWYYSQPLYRSFNEYLNEFSHYLVYTLVTILLVSFINLKKLYPK